ncbi:HPF/RaiA family ribosome-associated protein [Egbenema bharatensis]|uniref:HPF/RaiA family ribosome-associated protein n=1 Tax=Egbenema bharatensis TaxID=3463334 RepID=UPI003A8AB97B
MKVEPTISYRDVEKTSAIESLIQEKITKLEQVCDYISSCRIAVETAHKRPSHGSPYRVRIDMTVPPSHELVAESNPAEQNQYVELDTVIRDAFSRAERQLRELARKQRESERTTSHDVPEDDRAFVIRIFRDQGYGFLKTLSDEEIYFHSNSVLHNDFERLEVGTAVRFVAAPQGQEQPHASTVQIIDKPGHRAGEQSHPVIEPPLGWQE